jgi:surface polysaccharide O-acyltransferase-like enzyme
MTKQKATLLAIFISILLSLFFYCIIEWIHINRNIPYGDLTRDPNAIHDSPKYIGLLSQTGMIFWFSTAGILLFAAFLMFSYFKDFNQGVFLGNAFFLTIFLGIDDMFMLHDELAHRGLREEYFYMFYGIWLLITLITFKKTITHTLYPLIFIYGLFFGISIVIDKFINEAYLPEDMLKFAGILNWCFYWSSTCYYLLQKQLQAKNTTKLS